MIMLIEERMPHIEISFQAKNGRLNRDNILDAYEDLTTAYNGVHDFINILDCICAEMYSLDEAIVAGFFITDALDGCFVKNGYREKAKYMRISGHDVIMTVYSHMILTDSELEGSRFDGDNGKHYRLSAVKIKENESSMKTAYTVRNTDTTGQDLFQAARRTQQIQNSAACSGSMNRVFKENGEQPRQWPLPGR